MQPPWAPRPAPTTDAKAIASLVLGLLCLMGTLCWMGAPLGVPAILLGALAHRDIRRSSGMTGGGGLATAGIAMGAVGSLVFATWIGFLVFAMTARSVTAPGPSPVPPSRPAGAATAPALVPPWGFGSLHVVDLHPEASRTLHALLAQEARAARTTGETVLVETVDKACDACAEIARAMPEPELQSALAHARVVRVPVDEFGLEAATLHLATPDLPWFYLVDTRGDPRDGLSADEWGDNDADEIAPVLEAFLGGTLRARKVPWRAPTSL